MDISHISKNLIERDKLLAQIEREIHYKEKFLMNKTTELDKTAKINSFLREVQKDYHTYSNAIIQERKKQMDAMNMLNEYVKEVGKATDSINHQREEVERDQEEIMHVISIIKGDMDKLISEIEE